MEYRHSSFFYSTILIMLPTALNINIVDKSLFLLYYLRCSCSADVGNFAQYQHGSPTVDTKEEISWNYK